MNKTDANINNNNESEFTCLYISSPAMMVKYEDKKNHDNIDNEIETRMDTLDKETEKSPYITSPAIMEECENKEQDD